MGSKSLRINLKKDITNQVVNYLDKEGQKIVNNAYWSKEAKDRSGSMHDAYGYAVYYNGKMMKKGYAAGGRMSSEVHHGWIKRGIPDDTGRGYLESFFEDYATEVKSTGFVLVCVNAIYYAQILEDGAQARPSRNISTRYRIISQITDEMYDLQKIFKNANVSLISPVGSFHK